MALVFNDVPLKLKKKFKGYLIIENLFEPLSEHFL